MPLLLAPCLDSMPFLAQGEGGEAEGKDGQPGGIACSFCRWEAAVCAARAGGMILPGLRG